MMATLGNPATIHAIRLGREGLATLSVLALVGTFGLVLGVCVQLIVCCT